MAYRHIGLTFAALAALTSSAFAQAGGIDYANAQPLALPQSAVAPANIFAPQRATAEQKFSPAISAGQPGDGVKSVVKLPKSSYTPGPAPITSQEYGTSAHPFTMAIEQRPELDPYRRAGKLFFKKGGSSYICSASLIKRGVVITAAHCVADFGSNTYHSSFQYVPAYSGGDAPYGVWTAAKVIAPKSYLNGTSKCSSRAPGVVCETDIAVIVLKPQSGRYAGTSTGFFGYATGGYGYNSNGVTQITQLGYPGSLNGGAEMIRTDSFGLVDKSLANNTVIGSGQTGGSSGGPWLVNFGFAASPDGTNPVGADANRLIVVGTTSWGYSDNGRTKQQGASFFNATVLNALVPKACQFDANACR